MAEKISRKKFGGLSFAKVGNPIKSKVQAEKEAKHFREYNKYKIRITKTSSGYQLWAHM